MGITVRNLSVGYQKPLLTGVHFTLQKGEILCVLGRNGSGKTTLFKTILGLLPKHAGEKDKAIAAEMMQQIGIWHLKDKAFSQMSGGEQQLTIIARALTQQPTYIVMDEPTSALDFGNQLKVLQQVKALQSQDIGIILSTHNPDHVFLCDSKVAVVKDHTIAALGTPDEVMTETLLKDLYEVEIKIINQKNRKICFPL